MFKDIIRPLRWPLHPPQVAELAEAWALWALEPSDADASDLRLRSATAAERLRGTVLHEELRQVAEMPGRWEVQGQRR